MILIQIELYRVHQYLLLVPCDKMNDLVDHIVHDMMHAIMRLFTK